VNNNREMKPPSFPGGTSLPGSSSPGFLLAQVGALAAAKFGQRLRKLGLAPSDAGILRILGAGPGITQQALAAALGMLPSRLVAVVDELEARGLVQRRENPEDRRRYALHLSEKGRSTLETVGRVAREHQQELLAALTEEERRQLAGLLQRIADAHGLARGVHPGYARLRPGTK
jgi:DNA-binding MarR family transcriptional regulator